VTEKSYFFKSVLAITPDKKSSDALHLRSYKQSIFAEENK